MNTKHTPGPWELVRTEKGELELGGGIEQSTGVYSGAGFGLVANVIYKKTNILGDSKVLQKQTFEANAALIAAAPELLEALKTTHKHLSFLRDSMEGNERLELDETLDSILKAIKKAQP